MEINRNIIIAGLVLLAAAYAFGRFSAPEKIKIQEKIVTVEKTDIRKTSDTDKKKHVTTTKTETVNKDGTKVIVTKTEENTDTKTNTYTKEQIDKAVTEERSKTVEAGRNRVTISALAGLRVTDLKSPPVFGGHISRPLIGPVTMGVWGMSNATAGVSLGLQF